MDKLKVKIAKFDKLTKEEIRKINKIWINEFGFDFEKSDKAGQLKDVFFMLYNKDDKVLSVGKALPKEIIFLGKKYKVYGIGGIASAIKGKGYGTILMAAIKKYIEDNNFFGFSFCARKNIIFYEKCGFIILKGLAKRLLFLGNWDKTDNDVFYINDKYGLMEKIKNNPNEKIIIPRDAW